jgi:hypothetical protein
LKDLKPRIPYPIHKLTIISSKYGKLPKVELESNKVFLPRRTTDAIQASLEKFVPLKYALKFIELRQISNLNPTPIFEIIEV